MKIKIIKPVKSMNYYMPTKVYFGRGAFKQLSKIIVKKKFKNILIVSGEHIKKIPDFNKIIKQLKIYSYVSIYKEIIKISNYKTIDLLTDFCRDNNFDSIIAIGGGTILDTAKCTAILSVHQGYIKEYVFSKTKQLFKQGLPFVAVPTTAGTGSEVTPWATVWGEDKNKYSLTNKLFMFPNISIVDPALTDTLSAKNTAETGIDALCQAVEAYWSIKNNPVSDKFALFAIKIIIENLQNAVINPSKKIRDKMMWGSLCTGLAFSNTETTICHALSYPITANWGISHGQATGINLLAFFQYETSSIPLKRQQRLLDSMKIKNIENGSKKLYELIKNIQLKITLSSLDIPKKGVLKIVSEASHSNRMQNSPRIPTTKELERILYSIY